MILLYKILLEKSQRNREDIVYGNDLQLLTTKDTLQNNYFALLQIEKAGAHGTSSKH